MIKKELNPECGNRLKECMKDIRMTQKELAEKSSYSAQYISYIITGKKNLSQDSAEAFAAILGVRKEYLLCKDDLKTLKHMQNFILDDYKEMVDFLFLVLVKIGGISIIDAKNKDGETIDLKEALLDSQVFSSKPNTCVIKINPKAAELVEVGLELSGIKKNVPEHMLGTLLIDIVDYIHYRCQHRFKKEFDEI